MVFKKKKLVSKDIYSIMQRMQYFHAITLFLLVLIIMPTKGQML